VYCNFCFTLSVVILILRNNDERMEEADKSVCKHINKSTIVLVVFVFFFSSKHARRLRHTSLPFFIVCQSEIYIYVTVRLTSTKIARAKCFLPFHKRFLVLSEFIIIGLQILFNQSISLRKSSLKSECSQSIAQMNVVVMPKLKT